MPVWYPQRMPSIRLQLRLLLISEAPLTLAKELAQTCLICAFEDNLNRKNDQIHPRGPVNNQGVFPKTTRGSDSEFNPIIIILLLLYQEIRVLLTKALTMRPNFYTSFMVVYWKLCLFIGGWIMLRVFENKHLFSPPPAALRRQLPIPLFCQSCSRGLLCNFRNVLHQQHGTAPAASSLDGRRGPAFRLAALYLSASGL